MKRFLVLMALAIPLAGFAQTYTASPPQNTGFVPTGVPSGCDAGNPVGNCSFETGDFTTWVIADVAGGPFFPLSVLPAGNTTGFGFFTSAPTDGLVSAFHGFDGGGPGTIEISQDISLPTNAQSLIFDYRGAWDMTFGATVDRTFEVQIQPSGGGAPMQSDLILTAVAGTTVLDTTPQTGSVNLTSFAGQNVRVAFVWTIPEALTGPGQFELDNVVVGFAALPVPGLNVYGLAIALFMLGGAGLYYLRRRQHT